MAGAREPAPLARFSEDWIGGNIRGLSAFAGVLYEYLPKTNNVASELDDQVSELVSAARWTGAAAKTFSAAWDKDSTATRALGSAADAIGTIVDQLAVRLAQIESALEDAAADARSHGVPIGTSGAPGDVKPPAQARFGPSGNLQAWANAYDDFYQASLLTAQQARQEAAGALAKYTLAVTSDSGGMTLSDTVTTIDLLGDMIALPAANQPIVKKRILKVEGDEDEAVKEAEQGHLTTDQLIEKLAKDDARLAHDDAELARDVAEDRELSKLLSTSVGDLTASVKQMMARLAGVGPGGTPALTTGAADAAGAAEGELGTLGKVVDFGKDIPVIDVAAAAIGTGLSSYSDVRGGQSVATALPEELAANVVGVSAGALAGGTAMTLVGGGLVGGVVAAGAAGAVAFGVGDFTDKLLHEDWGSDIHTYGVAGGVTYGLSHSAVATGDDFTGLGKDIGHTAEHLWDHVF